MDLGQVFTNKNVAEYMISFFSFKKNASLLDPCFGAGAFLQASTSYGYKNIDGYEIDNDLYHITQKKYPKLILYNKDFLSASPEKKYDGIIMNPPYVRQEKINNLEPLGITKQILRENPLFVELPSTANLYMYFILKSISLLKNNGELVVIFPSSWLQAKSGKKFQQSLYSKCTLLTQIYITGEVFEKNALVEVIILHLRNGVFNFNGTIKNVKVSSNGDLLTHNTVTDEKNILFNIPFSSIGSVKRGLTTGCNSMYINPQFTDKKSLKHLTSIISTPKAIEGYGTKNAKTDKLFFPDLDFEFTSEIYKHIAKWEANIKLSSKPKTLFAKLLKNNSWYLIKTIDSTGILFGYFVRNNMKFILNDSENLARDNFYIILPKIDTLLAFALLNNYYTYLQLEEIGKKYGAGLLKLQRYDIEALNFPNINFFSNEELEHLKKLSQDLVRTGNSDIVDEITKIIGNHAVVDYTTVIKRYTAVKKLRLEGHTNV